MSAEIKETFREYYNLEPLISHLPEDIESISTQIALDLKIPELQLAFRESLAQLSNYPPFRGYVFLLHDWGSKYQKILEAHEFDDWDVHEKIGRQSDQYSTIYFNPVREITNRYHISMPTYVAHTPEFLPTFTRWVQHHASFEAGCRELDRLGISAHDPLTDPDTLATVEYLTDTHKFQACLLNPPARAYIIYR